MIARLRQEHGIALVMALAFTVALSMLVFGMVSYVTSNQHSAQNSSADVDARAYAEAALDVAYSTIEHAGNTVGLNPANPALLGCTAASGSYANSDCSSATNMKDKYRGMSGRRRFPRSSPRLLTRSFFESRYLPCSLAFIQA